VPIEEQGSSGSAKEERIRNVQEERRALVANERESRAQFRRRQALEVMSEETVASLEQVFDAKLAAVRSYEQKLVQISDPYARRALQNMIMEERDQLIHLAELIELVEQSPETGGITRTRRQLTHRLKSGNTKNLAYGAGLALLGVLMYPTLRSALHPAMARAAQGFAELSEKAQGLIGSLREDMEDLVAEAEFEKLKQSIDSEITGDPTPPAPHE
jgi:hypothetical protein